eukprot:m.1340160 g.1340160  ORF g.1340160 m.1340160 type:complete len:304 (-) comp24890_c1_seq4:2902-3813(-)
MLSCRRVCVCVHTQTAGLVSGWGGACVVCAASCHEGHTGRVGAITCRARGARRTRGGGGRGRGRCRGGGGCRCGPRRCVRTGWCCSAARARGGWGSAGARTFLQWGAHRGITLGNTHSNTLCKTHRKSHTHQHTQQCHSHRGATRATTAQGGRSRCHRASAARLWPGSPRGSLSCGRQRLPDVARVGASGRLPATASAGTTPPPSSSDGPDPWPPDVPPRLPHVCRVSQRWARPTRRGVLVPPRRSGRRGAGSWWAGRGGAAGRGWWRRCVGACRGASTVRGLREGSAAATAPAATCQSRAAR